MRRRQGMTLVEIMVVLGVLALIAAVAIPSLAGVFDVQQRAAARELAQMYRFLLAEASLRNVTFRLAFNLDAGTWKIEVGDPEATVFGTPEELEAWEKDNRTMIKDRAKMAKQEEGEAPEEDRSRFAGLSYPGLDTEGSLPADCMFAWVYTPQYGQPQTPSEIAPEDAEEQRVVYSYVYPDGTADHTVVRIVDNDDPEDGYTVEIEPLSGETHVDGDNLDPLESLSWLPEDPPSIR
ncbi:MAG TPA: type II secretion system protein [Myxococcota bacterium]|nr:type II secretion system protein [Myxococcota bacterium]HNH47014.1 type II secretion system protein [Myxococcota bacterium]